MKHLFIVILLYFLASCMPEGQLPTKPFFDIPALIGKDIDEVIKALGNPKEEYPGNLKDDIGYLSYKKGGWNLSITYKPSSGKVVEFLIHAIPVQRFKKSSDLLGRD